MSRSPRPWVFALLMLTPAIWSVNYLVARGAAGVIEPHTLASGRWLLAALLLSLGHWRSLWQARHHLAEQWLRYAVLGALGMWICGAWVYIAGRTTSALNIALIYSVAPVLIVVASAHWLRERLATHQLLGILMALIGVLHVILKGQWSALTQVQWVPGDLWILACTVSWTAYSLLLKKWTSPLPPSARLSVVGLAGVLIMLPMTALEIWQNPQPALTWPGVGLVLAAALFPGYGAYLAYAVLQRELGAARAGVVLYVAPLYAAGMAWLLLGEPLHLYHAAGMALVLPGIYLVNRAARQAQTP